MREFCVISDDCSIQTKSTKRNISTKSTFTDIEPYCLPLTFFALRKYTPDKRKTMPTKSERLPTIKKRFDRRITLSLSQRVDENEDMLT